MFNEVNELLNENKIKMMTKMAIYEKNEGKSMLKTAKYFKGDYIAFGVLKTVIATTFAGVILLAMYFLCNAEGMIRDINNLDYIGLAKKFALYYVLMLIVFCAIAGSYIISGMRIPEKVLRGIFQGLISWKDSIQGRRRNNYLEA